MVDYLRKSSEAIILLAVVAAPWAFGATHPISRYFLSAAIGLVLLFWAVELLLAPRRILTRYQIPLVILAALVVLQILPLGNLADLLSPNSGALKSELMPEQLEVLADGNTAVTPFWTARGRVSVYPAETLRRLYWFALIALLFTRVQDLSSVETLRRFCFVCLINGSILSYFAVFQHFTSEPQQIYWQYPALGAAFGPFVNRNHFAFYVNICFGLSLGLVGSRLMGRVKSFRIEDLMEGLKDSLSLWMISVLVFMLGAVILCSSRGGMISLVGGTLITAAFIAATGSFQQSWKWFLLAAGIFAVAAGVQTWLGFDFVNSRYAMHNDNRTALWMPLLGLIPEYPLTGSGLGTLAYMEPFTRTSSNQMDTYLENAHNEYLQLVLEVGIPGLLCGVALLVMLFGKIARRVRSSRHNAWLYVGALFGLCTITLHSFVEFFGYSIPAITVLVAVLFGHIAGLGRIKKEAVGGQPILGRAFALLMIPLAFVTVSEAKRYDMADRCWRLGQRAGNEGRTDEELQQYLNAMAYAPNDAEYILDSSRIQFQNSRSKLLSDQEALYWAQNDLIRARELCPLAAEAHFLIGQAVDQFERSDGALTYFDRALLPRPVDETLWFIIGRTHLGRGDSQTAAKFFRQSLSLNPRHLPEILTLAVEQMSQTQIVDDLIPKGQSVSLIAAADWFLKRSAVLQKTNTPTARMQAEQNVEVAKEFQLQALDTAELQNPNSAELYYRKAKLLKTLERLEEASEALKQAVRFEPRDIRWRMEYAVLLGELEDFDEALAQIRRVKEYRPSYAPATKLAEEIAIKKNSGRRRQE